MDFEKFLVTCKLMNFAISCEKMNLDESWRDITRDWSNPNQLIKYIIKSNDDKYLVIVYINSDNKVIRCSISTKDSLGLAFDNEITLSEAAEQIF